MAEAPGEALSPVSSFKGQLDINNFKLATGRQPDTQASSTMVRSSKRIAARVYGSFKPTKPEMNRNISLWESGKKRKIDSLSETTRPDLDGTTSLSDLKKHKADGLHSSARNDISDSPDNATVTSPAAGATSNRPRGQPEKPGYAPPETFAHLGADPLPDAIGPNLYVLLCGLNPGIKTARTGHAYSNPTNRFWNIMYSSGVLPVPCTCVEDHTLPDRFKLGLTNIVTRPSRNGAQLSKAEMDAGVPALQDKVRRWRPAVVCLVGKSIWESVWRVHHGKAVGKAFNTEFRYGWQDESESMGVGDVAEDERLEGVVYSEDWKGARVFVASSTSGLAATLKPAEKEKIWRELGVWVEERRSEEAT